MDTLGDFAGRAGATGVHWSTKINQKIRCLRAHLEPARVCSGPLLPARMYYTAIYMYVLDGSEEGKDRSRAEREAAGHARQCTYGMSVLYVRYVAHGMCAWTCTKQCWP